MKRVRKNRVAVAAPVGRVVVLAAVVVRVARMAPVGAVRVVAVVIATD